ncbi:PD-(D/E)XK nuclease family protein [Okeanomitos corallinicola TIOX110]|uniref:PD-(D/E)XK nuclease family protein n=1 Tax=Okeanomitos corallinicola TIOX110 TaxID=3133117 RepID=A0ABZ2UX18_9CYAN
MSSTAIELFRLSQGHLNLLVACPRKFQHTYLEKLNTPTNPTYEKSQTLGSQFHLLMQQQAMNLPIDGFLAVDSELQIWVKDFNKLAPEILKTETNNQIFRESEHYRTLQIQDYLITVIYDLLIAEQETAQIIDWKTYAKSLNKDDLENNWQTRLYMYVLAETSIFLPENISMTYWFVNPQNKLNKIQFNYNIEQHQKTEKTLQKLLNNLTNWLVAYQQNQPFPQEPAYPKACKKDCPYYVRCYNSENSSLEQSDKILPNLATIEEIAI